jgi:NAD(P)-dependent dehydrogenase (short-subunit alcohol dehydrogenase family)
MAREYTGYDKDFSLRGKVAFITGGYQGIGNAIATLFAEKGADLALVDVNDELPAVAESLGKDTGRTVKAFTADLTKSDQVRAVVQDAVSAFGRIDILVNNAGVVFLDEAEDLSEEDWDKTMAVNLKGAFLVAQAVGREMIKAGGGKIVNMASQAGVVALDRHLAYCTSKAGIISMTKVLAFEWGEYNINVNAISPTVVLTELGKKAWAGEVGERFKEKLPVGRFAYPEEVAALALYLASDAANMVSGENILIDGGYTAQ